METCFDFMPCFQLSSLLSLFYLVACILVIEIDCGNSTSKSVKDIKINDFIEFICELVQIKTMLLKQK